MVHAALSGVMGRRLAPHDRRNDWHRWDSVVQTTAEWREAAAEEVSEWGRRRMMLERV